MACGKLVWIPDVKQNGLFFLIFGLAREPHAFGGIVPILIGSAHSSHRSLTEDETLKRSISSAKTADVMGNFAAPTPVAVQDIGQRRCGWVMEKAEQFRQYAAECRRLAKTAAAKDKVALLEIADAWIAVAEELERNHKPADKT